MSATQRGLLSVVVPAYREGPAIRGNLAQLREALLALDVEWEVIVVSDGNTDATAAQARAFDDGRVQVLEYERNRGKGYAVRTGVRAAAGEWIAFIDADMEISPSGLAGLLDQVRGGADVAVGSKRHRDSHLTYPLFRRLQSRVYQQVIRGLFQIAVTDTQTGLKVFRGDALRAVLSLLRTDGFAFDLEWLVVLGAAGAQIVEGPVTIDYTFETTTGSSAVRDVIRETVLIRRRLSALRSTGRIPHLPAPTRPLEVPARAR